MSQIYMDALPRVGAREAYASKNTLYESRHGHGNGGDHNPSGATYIFPLMFAIFNAVYWVLYLYVIRFPPTLCTYCKINFVFPIHHHITFFKNENDSDFFVQIQPPYWRIIESAEQLSLDKLTI